MRMTLFLGSLLLASAAGCSRPSVAETLPEPLTVAEWKTMLPQQKYEIGTLERLKVGEPRLQNDREWERFLYTVVAPGKRAELPGGK